MTTLQTEWDERELLASHRYSEPLVAGGARCHGGFDEDGRYVSPRTLNRGPAIVAWQDQHAEQFGRPLLDIELAAWPEHYPNLEQSRYLLSERVVEPFIAILTRIGTVEGFGSMLRQVPVPALAKLFTEDIRGTAMAHLDRGLYEAHARDEAGFGDEGGHDTMWFAARDVAFEHPVTGDETALMMQRMGIGGRSQAVEPLFPDIDPELENMIARMSGLLLIEISAFHTFAWAEALLADTELVAGDGQASRLVAYIRADETPHVEYLKTALSEMRDRTVVTTTGRTRTGDEVIGGLWDRARELSLGARRNDNLNATLGEIDRALDGHPRRDEILERFHQLGTVRPGPDGSWIAAAAVAAN